MTYLNEYYGSQTEQERDTDREMIDTFCNNGYAVDYQEVELPEGITLNGSKIAFVEA